MFHVAGFDGILRIGFGSCLCRWRPLVTGSSIQEVISLLGINERRMYLPLLGLILVACDLVERQRLRTPAIWGLVTAIALTFGSFCFARNQLWGRPELLIVRAAEDAQHNPRPLLNLAEVLIGHNRCDLAVPYLERAERTLPRNYYVNASWGRVLACLGRADEGMQHLQLAAQLQPCSQVYLWIGQLYDQMGRSEEAGTALQTAVRLDPASGPAHGALALWYESIHKLAAAEKEYSINVALAPDDETARLSLARGQAHEADTRPPNLR